MATVTRQDHQITGPTVLRGVSFREYVRLARLDANRHLRMAYFDGTLEIMSPRLHKHERPSRRINLVIMAVADALGIPHEGVGQATFHRPGDGPRKGTGREADQSYYFGNIGRLPQDRDPDLDAGDPPPDLWVEVDNRASSRARLPTYARLGVPEVWQYRAETGKLRFLRLDGTAYTRIDHSMALPVLTPALVVEAMRHGLGMIESEWSRWLRGWAEQFRPGRAE